ncbi:MAG TPA: hypothetical protein VJ728_09020 [Candidatus Binataceae bacterium]|nr:hypothetical protein [Candidatus Binataceae bacterium]
MAKQRLTSGTSGGGVRLPHKSLENIGLIVIAILILAITLTRYWHNIHWSLR